MLLLNDTIYREILITIHKKLNITIKRYIFDHMELMLLFNYKIVLKIFNSSHILVDEIINYTYKFKFNWIP